MTDELTYRCIPYAELTLDELYEIMVLRQRVFVVEQDCPYVDADGKDDQSWHLTGLNAQGKLVAYARILPVDAYFSGYASIGRVVTAPEVRQQKHGRSLMLAALECVQELWGKVPIKIMAQTYLLAFYASLGFQAIGEEYLEDDIPHVDMVKRVRSE